MVDSICLFESVYYERLLPLVFTRPVYDLRCGVSTLREKILRSYPRIPVSLHCRQYLADRVREQNPGVRVNEIVGMSCLFVNGRVIADSDFGQKIPPQGEDALFVDNETIIAARVSGERLARMAKALGGVFDFPHFEGLLRHQVDAKTVRYPWDLVAANGKEIVADVRALTAGITQNIRGTVYDGAMLVAKEQIFIGEGSKVKPGAVLDAEKGPIYIGNDATIYPNATIEGPAFVGDKSLVRIGAKIYENTSIGPVCKVGGEVEDSIIHSHSNKQHEGFLGHAYLGMWVNLGADTNNSDLKNNYGSVRVYINGEPVDSGSQFVGLTMGDHAKSSINTMFNTGTVVGVASNVFGAGFPPKYIPSFAWGGPGSMSTYDLEKALDVARRVMGRRKMALTAAEEAVFRQTFELTREERKKAGMAH